MVRKAATAVKQIAEVPPLSVGQAARLPGATPPLLAQAGGRFQLRSNQESHFRKRKDALHMMLWRSTQMRPFITAPDPGMPRLLLAAPAGAAGAAETGAGGSGERLQEYEWLGQH